MKTYNLYRWHSSDSRPSVIATGSLKEMRDEMKASVKGNEISGLYPARGYGNDSDHITVAYNRPRDGSWGIQYWIDEAIPETFKLVHITESQYTGVLFRNRSVEQVNGILAQIEDESLDNWRVQSDCGTYVTAREWKLGIHR